MGLSPLCREEYRGVFSSKKSPSSRCRALLRDNRLGATRARYQYRSLWWRFGTAAISYLDYLRNFFYPVGLAPLSPRPSPTCRFGRLSVRPGGFAVDHRGSLPLGAKTSLSAGRLAVVSGNVVSRDRTGAVRNPGDGRPFHLPAADRALHRLGLGGGRVVAAVAAAAFGMRIGIGRRAGRVGGLRLASDHVLERQRTLWNHTIACTSNNYLAHEALGKALAEKGSSPKPRSSSARRGKSGPTIPRSTSTSASPRPDGADDRSHPATIAGRSRPIPLNRRLNNLANAYLNLGDPERPSR